MIIVLCTSTWGMKQKKKQKVVGFLTLLNLSNATQIELDLGYEAS